MSELSRNMLTVIASKDDKIRKLEDKIAKQAEEIEKLRKKLADLANVGRKAQRGWHNGPS